MNTTKKSIDIPNTLFIILSVIIFVTGYCPIFTDNSRNLGLYYFLHGRFIPNPLHKETFIWLGCIVAADVLFISINRWIDRRGAKYALFRKIFDYAILILLMIAIAILTGHTIRRYSVQSEISDLRNRIAAEKTVIHACGSIKDQNDEDITYTNSLEALLNSLDHENRFIEIDFDFTSDDRLVCQHYFDDPVTEEKFMSGRIHKEFTRMNLDTLAEVMLEHPDFYVITDIKNRNIDGCAQIAARYPELIDRFIVQVYHDSEYEPISELGFKYFILTLYGTVAAEREIPVLRENMSSHDYLGITFWELWTYELPNDFTGTGLDPESLDSSDIFYREVTAMDIPVYVHTVNERETMKKDIDAGVSAIYTDNTDNAWLRSDPPAGKW